MNKNDEYYYFDSNRNQLLIRCLAKLCDKHKIDWSFSRTHHNHSWSITLTNTKMHWISDIPPFTLLGKVLEETFSKIAEMTGEVFDFANHCTFYGLEPSDLKVQWFVRYGDKPSGWILQGSIDDAGKNRDDVVEVVCKKDTYFVTADGKIYQRHQNGEILTTTPLLINIEDYEDQPYVNAHRPQLIFMVCER